jgi:hypothetical protein
MLRICEGSWGGLVGGAGTPIPLKWWRYLPVGLAMPVPSTNVVLEHLNASRLYQPVPSPQTLPRCFLAILQFFPFHIKPVFYLANPITIPAEWGHHGGPLASLPIFNTRSKLLHSWFSFALDIPSAQCHETVDLCHRPLCACMAAERCRVLSASVPVPFLDTFEADPRTASNVCQIGTRTARKTNPIWISRDLHRR